MLRRVTMAAVVAVVAAAMAAPAALAQDDYSTTQVEYGDDVYGGTEAAPRPATNSAGQTGGAWTKFSAKLSGDNEVGGGDLNGQRHRSGQDARHRGLLRPEVDRLLEAIMAHIHWAPAGKNGDVVVPFFTSETPLAENSKSGCVTRLRGQGDRRQPEQVLRLSEFPKGAARGQLVAGANADQLAFTGGPMSKGMMLLGLCVIAPGRRWRLASGGGSPTTVHATDRLDN